MYISITPQKLSESYGQSVSDFVDYLEKENEGLSAKEQEHFFNQTNDHVSPKSVIDHIDTNTTKLKKVEPKFYAITVSPSAYELKHLQDHSQDLKRYTREFMKDYADSFNREISGNQVTVNDIVYYAKIEHQRTYKGTDVQVRENAPFRKELVKLQNDLLKINKGELSGNISQIEARIGKLIDQAPHKINGKLIEQGMKKEGLQTHIHIIVSRKDASNSVSLSPGSKYKASDVELHGKMVKRGFDRDRFFDKAEKTFDRAFNYDRNFVEQYASRKDFIKNPKDYFRALLQLPANEKTIALKILRETGLKIPSIPMTQGQLAFKALQKIRKGLEVAVRSSSIGI